MDIPLRKEPEWGSKSRKSRVWERWKCPLSPCAGICHIQLGFHKCLSSTRCPVKFWLSGHFSCYLFSIKLFLIFNFTPQNSNHYPSVPMKYRELTLYEVKWILKSYICFILSIFRLEAPWVAYYAFGATVPPIRVQFHLYSFLSGLFWENFLYQASCYFSSELYSV